MVGPVPTIHVFRRARWDTGVEGIARHWRRKTWMVATRATMTGRRGNRDAASFSRMGEGGAERRMRARVSPLSIKAPRTRPRQQQCKTRQSTRKRSEEMTIWPPSTQGACYIQHKYPAYAVISAKSLVKSAKIAPQQSTTQPRPCPSPIFEKGSPRCPRPLRQGQRLSLLRRHREDEGDRRGADGYGGLRGPLLVMLGLDPSIS